MPELQWKCERPKLFITLPARACSHRFMPLTLSCPVSLAHYILLVRGEARDVRRRLFVSYDASLCQAVVSETLLKPSVTWKEVSQPNGKTRRSRSLQAKM